MKFKRYSGHLSPIWLFSLLLLFFVGSGYAAIPEPVGFVNDFAGIMSEDVRNRINDWAIELREKTGSDFFIATFSDIGGASEVDYGVQVYKQWKIGSQRDEGVLIMLALAERKIRVEVGYGAEGYITDAYANEVYTTMRGFLSKGSEDWDQAFTQGSLMLLSKLAGEKGVTLTGMSDYAKRKPSGSSGGIGLLLFFIFLVIITRGRILEVLMWLSIFGGGGGGGSWGGRSGGSWGGGSSGGFGGFGGFGGGGGGRSGGGGAGGGF